MRKASFYIPDGVVCVLNEHDVLVSIHNNTEIKHLVQKRQEKLKDNLFAQICSQTKT
jgi:hypothetical protein